MQSFIYVVFNDSNAKSEIIQDYNIVYESNKDAMALWKKKAVLFIFILQFPGKLTII